MSRRKRIQPKFRSLKDWRDACELSQREAADILGLSQAGYSKIELGQRHPRRASLRRIADVTGVPVDVLAGVAL